MSMEQNAKYIYAYMLKAGWSKQAVCGMLGNIQSESGIENNIWEGGVGPGYGLVQWTPASKLQNWCSAQGMDWHKISAQCARIDYEMKNGIQFAPSGTYGMTGTEFIKSTESPSKLGLVFLANYERPLDPSQPQRASQAVYWYNKLSGEDPIDISEDPSDAEARKEAPTTPNFYVTTGMDFNEKDTGDVDYSADPIDVADDKIGEVSIEITGVYGSFIVTNPNLKKQVQKCVRNSVKGSARFTVTSTITQIIKSDCEFIDLMCSTSGIGRDTPIAIVVNDDTFNRETFNIEKLHLALREYVFQMHNVGYKNIVISCNPDTYKEILEHPDKDDSNHNDENDVKLEDIILWDPNWLKGSADESAKIWTYAGNSDKSLVPVATDTDGILTKHDQTFISVPEDEEDKLDMSLWDMNSKKHGGFVFLEKNVDYPDSFYDALKNDKDIKSAVIPVTEGYKGDSGIAWIPPDNVDEEKLNKNFAEQAMKCQDAKLNVALMHTYVTKISFSQSSPVEPSGQARIFSKQIEKLHPGMNQTVILNIPKNSLTSRYQAKMKEIYSYVGSDASKPKEISKIEYDSLPNDEKNEYAFSYVKDKINIEEANNQDITSVNYMTHEFFNEFDKTMNGLSKRNSAFDLVLVDNMNIQDKKYPSTWIDINNNIYKNETNINIDDPSGDHRNINGNGSWDILSSELEDTTNYKSFKPDATNNQVALGDASGSSDDSVVGVASSLVGYFINGYEQQHDIRTFSNSAEIKSKNDILKNGRTDCSGYVWIVLKLSGHPVPENVGWFTGSMQSDAQGMHKYLAEIPKNEAGPGDVLIANAGGTAGAGDDGHTAIIASKWNGGETSIYSMGSDDGVIKTKVKWAFGRFSDSEMITARPNGGSSKTESLIKSVKPLVLDEKEKNILNQTFKNYGLIQRNGATPPEKRNVFATVMDKDNKSVGDYNINYGIDWSGRLADHNTFSGVDNFTLPVFLVAGSVLGLQMKKKLKKSHRKTFSFGFWHLFDGLVQIKAGYTKLLEEATMSSLPVTKNDESPSDIKNMINDLGYIQITSNLHYSAYSDHSGKRWLRIPLSDGDYYINSDKCKFLDPKPPERK